MNNEAIDLEEIEQFKSFNSPLGLIKKAFSSFFIVLMIAAGFVVNWIMALIYLFGSFGSNPWLWAIVSLVLMLVIFPFLYVFLAVSYGKSVLAWEAYKEGVRPIVAKIFSGLLDKFLVDDVTAADPINEAEIAEETEERQKNILEKMPDFIRAYFQLFFNSKDVLDIVREQRQSGASREVTKAKATKKLFEGLDLQMSELMEPSLIPFYIVGALNVVVLYFLF